MTIADIPLEKIDESSLQGLITDEVQEDLRLEFKEKISFGTADEKKELFRDVSAFANTAGGDILYGIKEEQGKPVKIIGLTIEDTDKLKLQLESTIRDGLEPRLSGHVVHPVRLQSGQYVIVMRIPRSYAGPHRVAFQSKRQFFARRSGGKYELEINELRNAFLLSETAAERIRSFRVDRVAKILAANELPSLGHGPKLITHLIPVDAFQTSRSLNIQLIENRVNDAGSVFFVTLNRVRPNYHRYNLDGFMVMHAKGGDPVYPMSICQWHRNGIIESIDNVRSTNKELQTASFRKDFPESIERLTRLQKELGVQPPVFIMLTVTDAKNYQIALPPTSLAAIHGLGVPFDRDLLILPEVMIGSFECAFQEELKPIVDVLWQAGGYRDSTGSHGP